MELKATLGAFERLFGCPVSFHYFGGQSRFGALANRCFHVNPFCVQVKELGEASHLRCQVFDNAIVQERLGATQEAFFKLCHGGALELVLPIVHDGRQTGVMFVGPLAPGEGWDEELDLLRQPASRQAVPPPLRTLRRDEADDFLRIAALLAEGVQNALADKPPDTLSRPERIKQFFDQKFDHPALRLEDLASWLGVSGSRCCQLLRQHCGKSFPEMLAGRRMEHARMLLRSTFYNTETVGRFCGYPESPYFYKVFKRLNNGETPAAYRKKLPPLANQA